MKKTVKCYLHYKPKSYGDGFEVWDLDMTGDDDRILITALDVVFDVPDDFDPRPLQIKALYEKQEKAAAAFHTLTTEIMRQINELQALEMTA